MLKGLPRFSAPASIADAVRLETLKIRKKRTLVFPHLRRIAAVGLAAAAAYLIAINFVFVDYLEYQPPVSETAYTKVPKEAQKDAISALTKTITIDKLLSDEPEWTEGLTKKSETEEMDYKKGRRLEEALEPPKREVLRFDQAQIGHIAGEMTTPQIPGEEAQPGQKLKPPALKWQDIPARIYTIASKDLQKDTNTILGLLAALTWDTYESRKRSEAEAPKERGFVSKPKLEKGKGVNTITLDLTSHQLALLDKALKRHSLTPVLSLAAKEKGVEPKKGVLEDETEKLLDLEKLDAQKTQKVQIEEPLYHRIVIRIVKDQGQK
jgi:hypothetical protein